MSKFRVREGIASVWYYHVADESNNPLCGNKQTMSTEIPIESWGRRGGNVPASYCTECTKAYLKRKPSPSEIPKQSTVKESFIVPPLKIEGSKNT